MPQSEESLLQFGRHTPRILRKQLILQLAEVFLTSSKPEHEKDFCCKPSIQRFNGALLFVDISGFTALSLRLNVEELKNHINEYFTKMLDIVDKHGGDVVKFAGDALFIIWECVEAHAMSEEPDAMKVAVEKAVECGKEINESCSNHKVVIHNMKPILRQSTSFKDLESSSTNSEGFTPRANSARLSPLTLRSDSMKEEESVFLNVHSGVSVGLMAGVDIGLDNRWEYFLVGDPLSKVAEAESLASTGDIIMCPESHSLLHPEQKTHFSGIVSAVRRLFRHESTDPSKRKAVTLPCGCVSLKDGYCKVSNGSSNEKRLSLKRPSSSFGEESRSTLNTIKSDVNDVYKAYHSRFMKEFLKRSQKTHAVNSSEDYELCDLTIQKSFCTWVEANLADDLARHVHQVMRSEHTFSTTSRYGAFDVALDDHHRRTLFPISLMTNSDLFDDMSPRARTPTRNSPLLTPLSRNGSPGPSRTSSPMFGRGSPCNSRTASPVQNRIAASIANAQAMSRGSPMTIGDNALLRTQSSITTDGYASDGSVSLAARSIGNAPSGDSRGHLVSSRMTLRRRAEGNLLMSSFTGGVNAKSSLTAEIRTVTVMFVKLVIPPVDLLVDSAKHPKKGGGSLFLGKSLNEKVSDELLLDRFQSCFEVLANALTTHGGQMRQFIVDDKGTVCIGTFGLRGSVSDDNAAAAMEAAHVITVKMQQMEVQCSIGVTVGKAYCGLVGSSSRHEYAVMGPSTNLSARLMCKAPVYGVICDGETRHRDRSHEFLTLADVNAKGYSTPVPTFKPIFPEVEALLNAKQELSARVLRGLSLYLPPDDMSSGRITATQSGGPRKIIGRMIGSKVSMVYRDSHNVKIKLHGRSDEAATIITYLLSDLVDPIAASAASPVNRPLFDVTQPAMFVGLNGPQGIGKSCLIQCISEQVATVAKCTANCNLQVLRGRHDRLCTGAPFSVWRNIIHEMIVRIHRIKKETPRRKKSFVVGLSSSPKDLMEAALFVLTVLPAAFKNFLPLLGYLGVIPADPLGLADLGLSSEDVTKCCIDLQIAIIQMYVSATKNLVFLAMDDVHIYDDASLLLLIEVYAVSRGIVVLFSRRSSGPSQLKDSFASDNGTMEAQFAVALYEAGRFQAIEMDGLDKAAITSLVKDVLLASKVNETDEAWFDKVYEVCGGNPFYAFEIAKSFAENQDSFSDKTLSLCSVRIEEVICHRFDKLKTSAQTLLKMAAVACSNGSTFTLAMLCEIDGTEMSASYNIGLENLSNEMRNASILLSVLQTENFIGFASPDKEGVDSEEDSHSDLTVAYLLNGNFSFQFNVALEQSIIYNLLLDDQKHAIHQSVAEYYKSRRENPDHAALTAALYREEGFHWENACVMNNAMVCYYEAYVGDQDTPKNSEYLDKAFAMYNAMKESTELIPDPQGISFASLERLVVETFQNDGVSNAEAEADTDTLKLDRVFQIFDGDASMLETALAIMIEVCLQRIRRFEGSYYTQLILEDAIQMVLLTKTPFLMSSKYLANLVHSVTEGVAHVANEDMHFCLYDHFSHFCLRVFSVYLMNYVANHSTAVDYSRKASCIVAQFLQLVQSNESIVDRVQALCLNALIQNHLCNVKQSLVFVNEMRSLYVFEEHSSKLIESYGSDHCIFVLTRTAKYYLLSNEPEKGVGLSTSCMKYMTMTNNIATLTCCVFRLVAILSFSNRYMDAQVVWTKYTRMVQLTKVHAREQVSAKVLQLYNEWLARRILQLSRRRNPNISALNRECTDANDLMDHVDLQMKMEHENAVFHYRNEVQLVFADLCLLRITCIIEDSVKGGEGIDGLCKSCCRYLQTVMSVNTVDTRDAFNKAYCIKIATLAVKLVSDVQSSHRCLHPFKSLFSSQVLLQLRNEAEINGLHTWFESLAALYQALYGKH